LQVLKPINVVASEKSWATQYRLKAYPVDPRDQFRFITDLTVRGKEALAGLGVDFPAPYAQPPEPPFS
jgi:small conductance mechanosensitive channel